MNSKLIMGALAPVIWGTTYVVTTALLPAGRPLLAGAMRALPVGLLLALILRELPPRGWWWRLVVLGFLNIGLTFALIFVSAYRLPGGVAATLGAFQPMIVAFMGWLLLSERQSGKFFVSASVGVLGVGMLVLKSEAKLDAVGVAAAIGATVCVAIGFTLMKRWGRPMPLMAFTAWQLVFGGAFLSVMALLLEGLPERFTFGNLAGAAYLGLAGTGLAYAVYFRAMECASPTIVSTLNLLSPVTATLLGFLVLGQSLSATQLLGGLMVIASVMTPLVTARPNSAKESSDSPSQSLQSV